ncbi:MAG: YCF48-related protein [Bacteroidota bacterium]|nr:YCF48-related protein [Bacteroidota bacterium]
MKKVFIIFFLSGFVRIAFSQSEWININLGVKNFKSINFINQNTGFIFSHDGLLFKTTDGGKFWVTISNSGFTALKKGYFKDETFGYGLGNGYRKTVNGGSNWSLLNPIYIPSLGDRYSRDIFFTNENTCFVAGGDIYPIPMPCCFDGVIYKTTNSGINWSEIRRENFCEFTDIEFKDDDTGCVLSNYFILRTTNGGDTWYHQSDINVYGITMSDPFRDTIFIAGDGGIIIRSIDGGNNWSNSIAGLTYHIRNIQFINSKIGCAVGDSGQVVRTTNGGNNWMILNSGTTKNLNAVWFINKDTGFVVGDSGVVMMTTTGGLTYIKQNYSKIPEVFILYQNYPNPFNPETIIKFDIMRDARSEMQDVRLIIYDELGKEVETLVNERLAAGSYEVEFNGGNLSSGIYYYKLIADDFTETKKMVILR